MSEKKDEFKKVREEIRKNKEENRILKKRILEEIKCDREFFALRKGTTVPPVAVPVALPFAVPKDGDSVIIQIRTPDGSRLTITMQSEDTLSKLREEIEVQSGINMEEVLLIQSFPRKVFADDSIDSTLRSLGLFPKANLTLEKKTATENAFRPRKFSSNETQSSPSDKSEQEEGIDGDNGDPNEYNQGGGHQDEGNHDEGEQDEGDQDEDIQGEDAQDEVDEEEEGEEDDIPNQHFVNPGQGLIQAQRVRVPTYFPGPGYKALRMAFGKPDLTYLDRNRNDLAVEAAARRQAIQQEQEWQQRIQEEELKLANKQVKVLPKTISVLTLKDLSVHRLAQSVVGARPPRNIGNMPASLATDMISHLMKEELLRPNHLRYFAGCRLRSIALDNFKYCTNEILHGLRQYANLTRISLKNSALITDEGMKELSNLKNLRSLILSGCSSITDRSIPVITRFKEIEVLDLGQTCITDAGVKLLCEARLSKLSILNLKGTSISQKVIQSLSLLQNLKQLNLESCQLYDVEGIQDVKTLTDLNLSSTLVSTEAISRLQGLSQLKSLKLANMPEVSCNRALLFLSGLKLKEISLPNQVTLTDRGVQYLANMPLTTLDLSRCTNITDEAMRYVGNMKTLNKLILTNTKISDEGLKHLHGLKDLKELNLNRCQVTDDSANVFSSLTGLCDLSLSMTGITDDFIAQNTLKASRYLKKLNLSRTRVTEKGIEILKIPSLRVLNINETFVNPNSIPMIPGCAALTKIVCESKRRGRVET